MKLSEDDARALLAAVPVVRLATVGQDGEPHMVPITFALEGELIYTAVDHKPKTSRRLRRLRNIAEHPRVALLADRYSDDWGELWWVRVDGRARVIDDGGEFEHALDLLVARYDQYRSRRPAGPVIVIRAEHWTAWSGA